MIPLSPATRIFLASGATDLRKSFEGLGDLVAHQFKEDPLSGHLYVFANRRKNRVKLLYFRRHGNVGLRQAAHGARLLCLAQDHRTGSVADRGRGVDAAPDGH